jgi:hypothetical protein
VDTDALAACFAPDIDEALVRAIAACRPLRAVFRDAGFSVVGIRQNDSICASISACRSGSSSTPASS